MLTWLRALWRTLTRGRALDRELDHELDAYVDLVVDDAVGRGEDPDTARRQALIAMGGRAPVEEAVRGSRTGAWLVDALRDGRYGLRVLRRAPAFAASAILTLGLAIGTTAAIGWAMRTIVLAPLPYPEADRLLQVSGHGYIGEYLEFTARARTFDAAGHARIQPLTLTGRGEPVRLDTAVVTPNIFDTLGIAPALGTDLHSDDGRPGAEPVVMLSHRIWRDQLGAEPSVVGRLLVLDGVPRRVRGVMPATFAFPAATTGIWIPATINPADRIATWSRAGTIVGRLRDGHTLADAHAEVRALAPSFAALFPWRMPPGYGENASALSLQEATVDDVTGMLTAALGAVVVVLVIACLNVGILLVGRALARRTEMTTRAALGASRVRLGRQVLAESAMLAGLGGVLGLVLAITGTSALVRLLPADAPRLSEVVPDAGLAALVLLLTVGAGLLIGIAPVVRVARARAEPAPSVRASGGDRTTRAATRALVAVEVALAVVLVVGAALFTRSLGRLFDVDPGFDASSLTAATITPPAQRFNTPAARQAFFDEVAARVAALPDVTAVALTDRAPFAGEPWGSVFVIEGRPDPATVSGEWPWADVRAVVSAGYFSTTGIPVTAGRAFTPADNPTARTVVILNDTLARRYWPDESPISRRIRFPGMPEGQWLTIVGTVADTKWQTLAEAPLGAMYLSLGQSAPDAMTALVRSSADASPDALAVDLRRVVGTIDADVPVDRIAPVDARVHASAGTSRFLAVLFGGFALVGALLGAIGIYGVTADAVARRRHEIAVRLAMGADGRGVVKLMIRQGVTTAAVGLAVGLGGALVASRSLASLLYGVSAADLTSFTLAPAALLAAVVVASYLPARRATAVDPLAVLRDG
ncbi:MAG TPA: ADOP family duplicated permease [Vicinamibacterales bacterium]|nr:ADOP family duplicated permease [Vicinamibacterales bacterium]